MNTYEQIEVEAPAEQVVTALREQLRARGITEYAVVDHGRDMAAAGVTPHAAWTLVFGNPAAGEALLAREPAAAVDIPLRLAVIATAPTRSTIVLRPMRSLIGAEHPILAARFTTLLHTLADAARDSLAS
ncbi:MAG TPA: DUF302 domain-containing protein [Solirubrobacteraceae bacterium]|jgi:uncharacterized protein (DUF302 family)|nr:DUF302 domain-containing protein [Solirubrobacteraceae bacterium]